MYFICLDCFIGYIIDHLLVSVWGRVVVWGGVVIVGLVLGCRY